MNHDLRTRAVAALGASAALVVLGVVHVTHGTFDDQLTTTVDYVNDGAFTASLLLGAFALTGLLALGAPVWAVRLVVAGQLLVAVGVSAGIATGESPQWFAVVAVPGLLLWLVNGIRLAAWAWRTGALPRPVAAGLALLMPIGVIGGEFGGGLVVALVWLALGLRWLGADAGRAVPARA